MEPRSPREGDQSAGEEPPPLLHWWHAWLEMPPARARAAAGAVLAAVVLAAHTDARRVRSGP